MKIKLGSIIKKHVYNYYVIVKTKIFEVKFRYDEKFSGYF